jgi:hypothetical protein
VDLSAKSQNCVILNLFQDLCLLKYQIIVIASKARQSLGSGIESVVQSKAKDLKAKIIFDDQFDFVQNL